MAKSYKRGDDYLLYVNTGAVGSPTWVLIKAFSNLKVDPAPSDIVVPEAGMSDGHLQGYGDPSIGFTLYEDDGDTNVKALITAALAGTLKEIAAANGPIATTGTTFYRLESNIMSYPLDAGRGNPSSWDCEAKRHANSTTDFNKNIAA